MRPGTRLRSLFLFEDGLAVADFSGEMSRAHPGGAWGERAAVYVVVNSLTFNFPSIRRVKILVDGREADAVGFATAKRKGYDAPFRREFSVGDAKRQGLWNNLGCHLLSPI